MREELSYRRYVLAIIFIAIVIAFHWKLYSPNAEVCRAKGGEWSIEGCYKETYTLIKINLPEK